jgi:hypothetical protein
MEIALNKILVQPVQRQIKRMNGESLSPLGKAMFEWYQDLDEEKQTVVEQQITSLVNNFHQVSRVYFGPVAALELLGVLLLADPECNLASDDWWLGRRYHG